MEQLKKAIEEAYAAQLTKVNTAFYQDLGGAGDNPDAIQQAQQRYLKSLEFASGVRAKALALVEA